MPQRHQHVLRREMLHNCGWLLLRHSDKRLQHSDRRLRHSDKRLRHGDRRLRHIRVAARVLLAAREWPKSF